MNNDINIYSDIFGSIRIKQDAEELIEGIDDILASMYKVKGISFLNRINNRFPKEIAFTLSKAMEEHKIDSEDILSYKEYFDNLKKLIKKAKIADLTLSINPTPDLLTAISDFFRQTYSDQTILLSIRVDHSIVGGIELIWKGKYLNYSLDKKIDELFNNKHENI